MNNHATTEKFCDDDDFASMKMDEYCKDIKVSLEAEVAQTRHVGLWEEHWETHINGHNEDAQLKERLQNKYVNLKLYDRDDNNMLLTCTKAYFKKKRCNNSYCIFAVTEGYDPNKDRGRQL
jgi:hypothetical protein